MYKNFGSLAEFPLQCTSHSGPHSAACLTSAFVDFGCVAEGVLNPAMLSPGLLALYANMNLR